MNSKFLKKSGAWILGVFIFCMFCSRMAYCYDPQILFDPGHKNDENNLGAQGACDGIYEWQLTFPYAEKAYYEVLATPPGTGSYDWVPRITRLHSQTKSIPARVAMANNSSGIELDGYEDPIATGGVDLFLSVHCNSNEGTPGNGTETLYNNHPNNPPWEDLGEECYDFAAMVLAHYIDHTNDVLQSAHERATPVVHRTDVAVIRDTIMPSTLVETEFINNPDICPTMNSDAYRNAIGAALKESVIHLEWSWQTSDLAEIMTQDITSNTIWPPNFNRTAFVRNPNYLSGWAVKDYFVSNDATLTINPPAVVVLDKNVRLTPTVGAYINCAGGKILERAGAALNCGTGTAVSGSIANAPTEFNLAHNFPNPFNPATTIRFALPKKSLVSLTIYDERGSLVRELASQKYYDRGWGELVWDGTNTAGLPVASGTYFYRLTAQSLGNNMQSFSQTKKLLLVR